MSVLSSYFCLLCVIFLIFNGIIVNSINALSNLPCVNLISSQLEYGTITEIHEGRLEHDNFLKKLGSQVILTPKQEYVTPGDLDKYPCLDIYIAGHSLMEMDHFQNLAAKFRGRGQIIFMPSPKAGINSTNFANSITLPRYVLRPEEKLATLLVCPSETTPVMTGKGTFSGRHCKYDLKGRPFRVAAFGILPYVRILPNGHLIGASIDLMNIIALHLQMKMTYIRERNWSGRDKTGKLTSSGVDGQVYFGKADLGLGGLIQTSFALQELDFNHWTGKLEIVLCCFKPKVIPSYLNILLAFTPRVWQIYLLTNTLICLSAQFLEFATSRQSARARKYSMAKEWLMFFGLLVGQGHGSYDKIAKSIKILGLFTLTYSFVMEASFSCNLRAHLVEKQTEELANSLEDMLRLKRLYFYPNSAGLKASIDWHSTAEVGRTYVPSREIPQFVLEKMEFENACTISQRSAILLRHAANRRLPHLGSSAFNSLFRVTPTISSDTTAFIIAKGSPWKRQIDRVIGIMSDAGVINHLMKLNTPGWFAPEGVVETEPPETFALHHVAGQFVVLFVGLLMALLALTFEISK